ncbi:M20 family metallopeptidase [Aeromicrobium sp. UC242_57]|uniref:M20 family metallopeptidase n=1 Tax=Aeromicrobium sp. UC242_57 TaxID=3374624 RepID=UPI0037963201
MTRSHAIELAESFLESGDFLRELTRKVAHATESEVADNQSVHRAYLLDEIVPVLERCGCTWRIVDNPVAGEPPFLIAHRHEDDTAPTVLTYGHGDVVLGDESQWRDGLTPWALVVEGDRWYARGAADNKGQHTINLAALEQVLAARGGRLGFNVKILIDMGEEVGSPGLRELLRCGPGRAGRRPAAGVGRHPGLGDPSDVVPRHSGRLSFTLSATLRPQAYHSGNWGGLLRNPAVLLAHALSTLVDVDGRIVPEGLRPPEISSSVRAALADIEIDGGPGAPAVDLGWGEPGLTPAEQVYGWNTLEVLSLAAGSSTSPESSIPGIATARCQLRFVVGTDWTTIEQTLREHLDAHGLAAVDVKVDEGTAATRLDPDDPWVTWVAASIESTTGKRPAILPNLGGTLPNDCFADVLGMPTIWIPHSYPGCSQHGPDEHLLVGLAAEALRLMAGLFWDLGDRTHP